MDETADGQAILSTSVGQVPMDRLATIFDGMFDGVWLVAANGRTTYANGAMARLLGSTPSEMRGRLLTDFVDQELVSHVDSFLSRQLTHEGERIELTFRRADGSDLLGMVAGSPILTTEGGFAGTMLNVSDVTGKHKMDAQLAQNQRLEAIGAFAGGVAHDFNNLLTSIRGYTELARSQSDEGDPIRDDLDHVIASAERASAITSKLLAFTRRQVLVPVEFDPGLLISELLPILKPLVNEDIEIVLELAEPHDWIRADPGQLEQVLVNLAINARDAMPAGGKLTLAVVDLEPVDPERPDSDLTAGPFVRISVTDTGTGMDQATRDQIFDPFFTTKGLGKGTGLGLATVFGIVAQSEGQIQVETSLGRGTTFHIDLPRVPAGTASGEPPPAADEPLRGSGVILLVEDEAAVREFTKRALEASGYTVLAAVDAEQAIRASERWSEQIDVLLTDIVMPGVHGPELAAQIRAQRPGIPVVFISGYADDALGPSGALVASSGFLPKPYSIQRLVQTVAQAIAAGRTTSS